MKSIHLTSFITLAFLIPEVNAVTLNLSDVFGGIKKMVDSQSESSGGGAGNAQAGELVKDIKDGPVLSSKPYVRGVAEITYSVIPVNYETPKNKQSIGYGSEHAAPMIEWTINGISGGNNGIQPFMKDAVKPWFVRQKIENNKVYSNPYTNNISAFDLSKLNNFMRSEHKTIYSYDIKTHIKIPSHLIKKGKVVFEAPSGPLLGYVRKKRVGDPQNSFSQLCIQKIDGKIMSDKKMTVTVSKEETIDYGLSCYFGGYASGNNLHIGEDARDSIKDIYEAQKLLPSSWKVSAIPDPLAKTQGETYELTNKDIFLFEKEISY